MDMVGLPSMGLVNPEIHPDWTNTDLSHQFRGVAITVRYVSTQKKDRPEANDALRHK
jgi:hypothetical protein